MCLCAAPLYAVPDPVLTGQISASQVGGEPSDPYYGWYLYVIELQWNLDGEGEGAGLSHWDMIFKATCGITNDIIAFDSPAGQSTSNGNPTPPYTADWTGFFDLGGDNSMDPIITTPVIKYNDPTAQTGFSGFGTFQFYADTAPVNGTYTNALVAKAGGVPDTYGDLVGDAPACTVPEPATLLVLGLGGLALLRKRRV